MKELVADKQRVSKVQLRGNYLNLGDEVRPGTPAVFPALAPGKQSGSPRDGPMVGES
jgi:hypothetical protein